MSRSVAARRAMRWSRCRIVAMGSGAATCGARHRALSWGWNSLKGSVPRCSSGAKDAASTGGGPGFDHGLPSRKAGAGAVVGGR